MGNPTRMIIGLVALVGGLALGLQPISSSPAPTATQPADLKRASVVLAFFDALNRGDAGAAAAAFAENAFMIGADPRALCSLTTPCYDRTKIRENIDFLLKHPHRCDTVTSLQVTGSFVIGRGEFRGDLVRANGIERVLLSFMIQVLQDKIVAYFARSDLADPETARNVAIIAGTQPKGTPITVVPPCG